MKTLIYFSAPWCAPCKKFLPHVLREAGEAGITVDLVNIDTPNGGQCAAEWSVTSVPTVIVLDGGEPVDRFGVVPPMKLRERLA